MRDIAGSKTRGFLGKTTVYALPAVSHHFTTTVGNFATPHSMALLHPVSLYFMSSTLELVSDFIKVRVSSGIYGRGWLWLPVGGL